MAGGLFSFLWCLIVLVLSFVRITPGTSFFSEIDFASKLAPDANPSLQAIPPLPSILSLSDSFEIKRALARSTFYLKWNAPTVEQGGTKEFIASQREAVNGITVEPS